MPPPEREHIRYAHEAVVTMHAKGAAIQGRTTNVSRGGLCAAMADPLPMGADVECDIQLVFDDGGQSEPLRVAARVVWCTTLDDGYQVGLAFKPLPAERATYLTMFLRYLDDGAPTGKAAKPELSVDDQFG